LIVAANIIILIISQFKCLASVFVGCCMGGNEELEGGDDEDEIPDVKLRKFGQKNKVAAEIELPENTFDDDEINEAHQSNVAVLREEDKRVDNEGGWRGDHVDVTGSMGGGKGDGFCCDACSCFECCCCPCWVIRGIFRCLYACFMAIMETPCVKYTIYFLFAVQAVIDFIKDWINIFTKNVPPVFKCLMAIFVAIPIFYSSSLNFFA